MEEPSSPRFDNVFSHLGLNIDSYSTEETSTDIDGAGWARYREAEAGF
jgi:hypothetical protein